MISPLGSRYAISGALGRSVKRAASGITDPTDITGCLQWLDFSDANYMFTDAGTTKVSSDGDAIYQVNDKSGNNNHATQSTAGSRPLYKTGIKNSLPVARFDGTDDFLDVPELIEQTLWTLFVVYKGVNTLVASARQTTAPPAYGVGYGAGIMAGDKSYLWSGTGNSGVRVTASGVDYSNFNITVGRLKDGDSALYCNGVSKGTSTQTPAPYKGYNAVIGMMRGNNSEFTRPFTGDMAEIIWYDSSLSDTDRQSVETYLNNKWAIYS